MCFVIINFNYKKYYICDQNKVLVRLGNMAKQLPCPFLGRPALGQTGWAKLVLGPNDCLEFEFIL